MKSSTGDDAHSLPPALLRVDGAAAGMRADAFLARELPLLSRTRIRQKIQMGESLLNGRRFASSTRLREGDQVLVRLRGVPADGPLPMLDILYEDEILLAVDKPAGIAAHPMGQRQSGTVIQFARRRYADQIRQSLGDGASEFYPSLVNRLDVFSSGIVLIAKTRRALLAMHGLVEKRLISREYLALVEGTVAPEQGRIETPIGRDEASAIRLKMAARPGGRPSLTEFRVIRRLPAHTLLAVFPRTGRQHQIRVHLSAIGHPVWGDLLYKDENLFLLYQRGDVRTDSLPPRHCLHAAAVSFTHPLTGRPVSITAPMPEDFRGIVASLE